MNARFSRRNSPGALFFSSEISRVLLKSLISWRNFDHLSVALGLLSGAYDLAVSLETWPVVAMVLAEQFQIAVEREEWTAAESLIKRALEVVTRGPFDDYWTSALVFASAARAAAHRGEMREAREQARRAARLRRAALRRRRPPLSPGREHRPAVALRI